VANGRLELGAIVVPLLALMVFVAYVDRGNLATAGPLLQDELHLSATQLGTLLSSFFWTYVPGQILMAWLSERIGPYRLLALGVGAWAMATLGSGLVSGFAALLVLRLLLGVAESAAYPTSSAILAEHLPGEKLGMANAQIQLGTALGPAFGTFVGGHVMAHVGWRATFLGFGLLSLLWIFPWRTATRDLSARTAARARASSTDVGYVAIVRQRDLWGTCVGHFAFCYALYFVIYWLPVYLVKARAFTVPEMATIGALIYLVQGTTTMATGAVCDRLMRAGASANAVRKGAIGASGATMAASFVAVAFGSPSVAVLGLFTAAFAFGLSGPNVFAIPQTLAGARAAGKWVALMNGVGNVAGIVAPIVTGYVVDRTGQFVWAFVLAGGMAVTAVVGWVGVVRTVAPIEWSKDRPTG
jgi:MFS family permease